MIVAVVNRSSSMFSRLLLRGPTGVVATTNNFIRSRRTISRRKITKKAGGSTNDGGGSIGKKIGPKDPHNQPTKAGSIWIYIGWTILGFVGVDQLLQYKQTQEDNERRQILAQMQLDADNASFNVADWDETLPTIFTCKILYVDPGLDGTKMLTRSKKAHSASFNGINKNIKKGDVVEIIEAHVGPDKRYHLCRMRGEKSDSNESSAIVVGWYPIE
eukprot:CAMPEP_0197175094 /NCGR_PEP_ID=MMETSP1423-20130617/1409_1 /TAXON_ID=476441 /ORGANISM="Pseudo-nitzschia heimii, Strain UNC1101" /LENGTH=215 /DNA_ID=CAMNT_0042624163 /DNA_START=57 /DNA_END=701 /DNA_ORIENTATION=+